MDYFKEYGQKSKVALKTLVWEFAWCPAPLDLAAWCESEHSGILKWDRTKLSRPTERETVAYRSDVW